MEGFRLDDGSVEDYRTRDLFGEIVLRLPAIVLPSHVLPFFQDGTQCTNVSVFSVALVSLAVTVTIGKKRY